MSNFTLDKGAAGFNSNALNDIFVLRQIIDLAKVKNDTTGAITNLTAADTLNPVIKLPAGSAVLSAGVSVITAMSGAGMSSPVLDLGDSAGASNYINDLALDSTSIKTADGTIWETATEGVITTSVNYKTEDYLRVSFGGTLATASNGVIEVWAVVARVNHTL